MDEIQLFLARLGIAFVGAVLIGAASWGVARRKGRDTIGWYLMTFFPAFFGFLILLLAFPEKTGWYLSGILAAVVAPGCPPRAAGHRDPGADQAMCRLREDHRLEDRDMSLVWMSHGYPGVGGGHPRQTPLALLLSLPFLVHPVGADRFRHDRILLCAERTARCRPADRTVLVLTKGKHANQLGLGR